jgi:hypothetical protein
LKIHIYNFAILVNCPPQVMLLATDSDEDFIDVVSVAVASMLSFQAAGVNRTDLDESHAKLFKNGKLKVTLPKVEQA